MTFSPAYGYYDVTAYGAAGDGTTDDAGAIKSAELACESKGGVVYFPPGTYLIKSTIPIGSSNVVWMGAGAGASIIQIFNAATPFTAITVAGGTSNVSFVGLTVQGTNVGYASTPGPDALSIGDGITMVSGFRIRDCKFKQTKIGSTVHLYMVSDVEIEGCHFDQVGSNIGRHGDSFTTPAVYVDVGSVDIRIHNNHFEQYGFDGIRVNGQEYEISSNYFHDGSGSAITIGVQVGTGQGARIFGNYVENTTLVQQNNQGIYVQVARDFHLIGNTVKGTDGDGIAGGAQSFGAYVGNITFDNNVQPAGACGIQYISQSGGNLPNKGVAFVGNVSYDDQSPPTQQNGIRLIANAGAVANFPFVGNSFWGNKSNDITMDSTILNDNSDATIGNAGWIDRLHETSHTLTGSTSKLPLVAQNPEIDSFSMKTINGVRIVASGVTSSGGSPASRKFYLGFNAAGNLMNGVNVGSVDGDWQLEAYIVNDNSFTSQRASVHLWYNGTLRHTGSVTLGVTTSGSTNVLLEGKLGNSGDSIVTHFLSVERF